MGKPNLITLGFWESWRLGSRDRIKLVCNLAKKGDYIYTPMGTYYFNQPDAILHILQTHADCFVKQHTPYDQMMAALGPGVLTLDGDEWRQSRQRLQSNFRANTIEQGLNKAIPEILTQRKSQNSEPFDLQPFLHSIVTEAMLSLLVDYTSPTLIQSACKAIALSNFEVSRFSPWHAPIHKRKKLQKALNSLNNEVITNVSNFGNQGLLEPLLESYRQQSMTPNAFLGEIKNFLIAGAETTASTLAWVLYCTRSKNEIWEKITQEIRQTPRPNAWCSPQLPYTDMCIQETLRLYPSIWTILRRSIKKSTFANITIDKNAFIILSPYTMHQHPAFWDNPEQFNPENFALTQKQKRPKGVYIPFGLGKRICIGKQLAMATMKCFLFEWINRYDLDLVNKEHPGINPLVTLQPQKSIMVKTKPTG